MNKRTLDTLEKALQRQRAIIFGELVDTEADLRFIAEDRESELEERAQEARAARLLDRLDEREKYELSEVDDALRRIVAATYGACESCGNPIAVARLRAVPSSRYCVECAEEQERSAAVPRERSEGPAAGYVPPDLGLLSDDELVAEIREQVMRGKRIDTQELRVSCRKGVVHLDGALPSEGEHQTLLHLITDVIGLEDVVDNLQIEALLWEREDRTKVSPPSQPLPRGEEPSGTGDIVESHEEGVDYMPPVDPPPDEE